MRNSDNGAQGRTRTGMEVSPRRILSPLRLPISPLGLGEENRSLTNCGKPRKETDAPSYFS